MIDVQRQTTAGFARGHLLLEGGGGTGLLRILFQVGQAPMQAGFCCTVLAAWDVRVL